MTPYLIMVVHSCWRPPKTRVLSRNSKKSPIKMLKTLQFLCIIHRRHLCPCPSGDGLNRSGPKACVKWLLLDFYIKKNLGGGLLSKFGSKSSQISWGSQKNQIWSDRSGNRWRDNDRREKVPFQALIIKEIWEKCPKMRFLLFLTRFIKLYEKLTYFIL